jgi:hypothetical protein
MRKVDEDLKLLELATPFLKAMVMRVERKCASSSSAEVIDLMPGESS